MSKKPEKSPHSIELAEKWSENEVQLPRMPFFYINIYQFCMPIFFLMGFNGLILVVYKQLNLPIFIQIMLFPIFLIANVYLYIWSITKFCKILHNYWEKKSPEQEGIYSREFKDGNVTDPALHYYHLRGFMYKWPVWVAKKSFFPWLINFVLRDMAGNKISKDAIYGDAYVSLELSNLKEGAIVMEGTTLSSHVVDSIYGNLTIKEVTIEKNGVLHALGAFAPGGRIFKGHAVGPRSMVIKNLKVNQKESNFVWGIPAKRYDYKSMLNRLPDEFKEKWEIKKNKFAKIKN